MAIETTIHDDSMEHFGTCTCSACAVDREKIQRAIDALSSGSTLLTRTEIEDRCGYIASAVLGFDPRENEGPGVRTVNTRQLQSALLIAYHAGMTGR